MGTPITGQPIVAYRVPDDTLSASSSNAVQNKVVAESIEASKVNVTGASANNLVKILTVDNEGKPTSWAVAVPQTDYPSPIQYGSNGITLASQDVGCRNNTILLLDSTGNSIDDSLSQSIIIGSKVTAGTGSSCVLIGGIQTINATYYNILPNLRPIMDQSANKAYSKVSGIGDIAVGTGVNVEANTAAAFGAVHRVTGQSSFTAGGYNYVSGKFAGAIGRYLEALYNNQVAVGYANASISGDAFEVGNGDVQTSGITRSNAFRVTTTGSAIAQTSLGIDDGNGDVVSVNASELKAIKDSLPKYVNVSGTSVSQTGADNTMYFCGELEDLVFTAPNSGVCIIRFTSGTTPTAVQINNAVMSDDWPSTLEANRVYEISILNGYGVYTSWDVSSP